VYFPIIPKKIGHIKIQAHAQSLYAADAIEKQLLVKVNIKNIGRWISLYNILYPISKFKSLGKSKVKLKRSLYMLMMPLKKQFENQLLVKVSIKQNWLGTSS
jgi:hypothetical protein